MKNYYLPDNYPNTATGARLYIKDVRASKREEEEKKLTIKAVNLVINYNKNGNIQPLIDTNSGDDGAILFSIDLWDRFINDVGDKVHKEFKQREQRINTHKKPVPISKNKNDKYKIKYYVPEGYEDTAIGLQSYFTDLIRNSNTCDITKKELLLTIKVMKLIEGYHTYKEKEPLLEAIKKEPNLFDSEMFDKFYDDVFITKKYRPTKSTKKREKEDKHQNVVAYVEYYQNMGYPTYYESGKPNRHSACELTAGKTGYAQTTVEEIYKNKKKLSGWTSLVRRTGYNDWNDRLYSWHGTAIWVLNGFTKPESKEEIEQLEKILLSVSTEDELKKIEVFSRGFNARTLKLPRTAKELNKIKKLLNTHDNYEFIKSLQIKEIRLKK